MGSIPSQETWVAQRDRLADESIRTKNPDLGVPDETWKAREDRMAQINNSRQEQPGQTQPAMGIGSVHRLATETGVVPTGMTPQLMKSLFTPKPLMQGMANGGIIPGKVKRGGGDNRLVPMQTGEYVLPEETTRKVGKSALDKLVVKTTGKQPLGSRKKGFAVGGTEENPLTTIGKYFGTDGIDKRMEDSYQRRTNRINARKGMAPLYPKVESIAPENSTWTVDGQTEEQVKTAIMKQNEEYKEPKKEVVVQPPPLMNGKYNRGEYGIDVGGTKYIDGKGYKNKAGVVPVLYGSSETPITNEERKRQSDEVDAWRTQRLANEASAEEKRIAAIDKNNKADAIKSAISEVSRLSQYGPGGDGHTNAESAKMKLAVLLGQEKEDKTLEGVKLKEAGDFATRKYSIDENNKTREHDIAMKHEDRKSTIEERAALRKDNDEIKHENAGNSLLSRIQQRETELATRKRDGSVPVEEITELQRLLDEDRYNHAMKYGSKSEQLGAAPRYNEGIKRRRSQLVTPEIQKQIKQNKEQRYFYRKNPDEMAKHLGQYGYTEDDYAGLIPDYKRKGRSINTNPASAY